MNTRIIIYHLLRVTDHCSPERCLVRNVLIVEDSPKDVRRAGAVLKELGIQQVQVFTTVARTLAYLKEVLLGRQLTPDLLVLDLLFQQESGIEVLHFLKSHPKLGNIRTVVWTVKDDMQEELHATFDIQGVVSKANGASALAEVLRAC
jgi:CheY-like chemotaxis protein